MEGVDAHGCWGSQGGARYRGPTSPLHLWLQLWPTGAIRGTPWVTLEGLGIPTGWSCGRLAGAPINPDLDYFLLTTWVCI